VTLTLDRRLVWIMLVALALGWWLGSSNHSPLNPHPVPDRPVLTAFARVARLAARFGLWFALAAEKPPEPQPEQKQQLVKAPAVDKDGHRIIDHSEGW
jgi:alkanesulfonate monooxygenase SsuD/methylene tetrahydromethanopterin reductase-like flavin-dependent oxidoreductase (luciferase family)